MTRRKFIWESLAALTASGLGDVALAAVRGERRLRLGVVSDIHIHGGSDNQPDDLEKATESLLKAFRWFDAQGVDAVLIPGDLANLGRLPELQAVAATWEKAFPGGKGADGRPVEQLFLYGNHDSWRHSKKVPNVYDDRKKHWEETFHEPYEDVRVKTVKGYDFILASWIGWSKTDAAALEAAAKKCAAKGQVFFEAQHAHPKGTCHGPYVWGHDEGTVTRILSQYPKAVSFSGHSHMDLGDERTVWQGGFTSIGCGSFSYTGMPNEDFPPFGFENGEASFPADERYAPGAYEAIDREKVMCKNLGTRVGDGKQGMLVDLYDDALVIRRHEFVFGRDWPEVWEVPLPARAGGPFDPKARAKALPPCAFAAGATLSVREESGKSRDGIAHDLYRLTAPGGAKTTGCPLVAYDVGYVLKDKFLHLQYVAAGDFNLPPQEKKPTMDGISVRRDRVPPGARIEVRPVDCFGRIGGGVSCETLSKEA